MRLINTKQKCETATTFGALSASFHKISIFNGIPNVKLTQFSHKNVLKTVHKITGTMHWFAKSKF